MQQEQAVPQQPSVLSASQLLDHDETQKLKGFRKKWLGEPVGNQAADGVSKVSEDFEAMMDGASFIQPTTPASSAPEVASETHEFEVTNVLTGPVAMSTDIDTAVDRQFITNLDLNFIKLPWETGVMKQIFGNDSVDTGLSMSSTWNLVQPLRETFHDDVPLETSAHQHAPSSLFAHVVKGTKDLTYFEDRERMMLRGVAKWCIVIECDLGLSEIGRLCFDCPEEMHSSVRAALGTKSPNTVVSRANAFLAMMRWHCNSSPHEPFLPVTESMVWRYVQWLRDNNCPPTKPSGLMQSVRFAHYIFGIDGSAAVLKSRRVSGACDLALAGKPVTKQARALTVAEVKKIHSFAASIHNNVVDRTIAAHMLLMLYGRCRHSDTLAVESVEHDHCNDRGYIELNTRYHKGNKTVAKKSLVLPILIPTCGVGNELWAELWWESRMQTGLQTQGHIQGPLMPAPKDAEGSAWSKRPLTSEEVGQMLRSILDCPDDAEVSSHSLKVTTLTWCSKAEVPREHRRVLGRHSSSVQDADSLYARELSYPAVGALEQVISDICLGKLVPDGSRTSFRPDEPTLARTPPNAATPRSVLPQTPRPSHLNVDHPANLSPRAEDDGGALVKDEGSTESGLRLEVIDVSSSSSSSSGGEDSDVDSLATDDEQAETVATKRPRVMSVTEFPEAGEKWVKHKKTSVVHRCIDSEVALTFCGRSISKMFDNTQSISDWTGKCRICFKGSRRPTL